MTKNDTIVKFLFIIFFFVCLIDPFSLLLNLKNPIWILLIITCLFNYRWNASSLLPILIVSVCITLSYISGFIQGNVDDIGKLIFQYRAILPPLILLLWAKRFNLLRLYEGSVILTSIIVSFLFVMTQSNPEIRFLLNSLSSDPEKSIVAVSSEIEYLGMSFPMFYWGSLPSFTVILGLLLYKLFTKYSLRLLFYAIAVTIPFFVSGSRVPILIPFGCLYFVLSYIIINSRKKIIKYLFYLVPVILGLGFIYISYVLASDMTQTSNLAKYGHYESYKILFETHPDYMFIGQGIGSEFYSSGFGRMTDITELTYFEIVRIYGLLSVPLLGVIIYPIFKLWKYRKAGIIYILIWSYVIFLVSAGTNPKLLNTAGMLVVLVMYSVAYNVKKILIINEKSVFI